MSGLLAGSDDGGGVRGRDMAFPESVGHVLKGGQGSVERRRRSCQKKEESVHQHNVPPGLTALEESL